jgi:hypothetical protein
MSKLHLQKCIENSKATLFGEQLLIDLSENSRELQVEFPGSGYSYKIDYSAVAAKSRCVA